MFYSFDMLLNLICINSRLPMADHLLNSSQLAKMKSRFLTCPCHKIYREEAIDLKKVPIIFLYFKNYDFCEYVKFGAVTQKIDILSITV